METEHIRSVDISQIHQLPMVDSVGNDFAIFTDIQHFPLNPYPTRMNALCLALCLKGRCTIELNLQQYEMGEGMLAVILPDQIVQRQERSEDFSGIFLVASKNFMDAVIPIIQPLFQLFLIIKERPILQLTAEETQSLYEYHSFLQRKVKREDTSFRKEIIQGVLISFFYEIYSIYQGHTVQERVVKNRKEELFERFLRTISESYKENRSVAYYADKMFLTSKHLSTVIKEVSGKTAGEWIDSLVILEAKALLKSTELSIQEIADELHFASQSFFGKYFKNHTGMSPKEYRRQ